MEIIALLVVGVVGGAFAGEILALIIGWTILQVMSLIDLLNGKL